MASNSELTIIFSLLPCHSYLTILFIIKAWRFLILCEIWLKITGKVKSLLEQETNKVITQILPSKNRRKIIKFKNKKKILICSYGEKPLPWSIHSLLFSLLVTVVIIFDFQYFFKYLNYYKKSRNYKIHIIGL